MNISATGRQPSRRPRLLKRRGRGRHPTHLFIARTLSYERSTDTSGLAASVWPAIDRANRMMLAIASARYRCLELIQGFYRPWLARASPKPPILPSPFPPPSRLCAAPSPPFSRSSPLVPRLVAIRRLRRRPTTSSSRTPRSWTAPATRGSTATSRCAMTASCASHPTGRFATPVPRNASTRTDEFSHPASSTSRAVVRTSCSATAARQQGHAGHHHRDPRRGSDAGADEREDLAAGGRPTRRARRDSRATRARTASARGSTRCRAHRTSPERRLVHRRGDGARLREGRSDRQAERGGARHDARRRAARDGGRRVRHRVARSSIRPATTPPPRS